MPSTLIRKENANNFQDARPVDISRMNAETLDMELEKGYADIQARRTKSATQVFADIRRDYNV